MLIEKYCEDESWRAGYREACFDLCVGNLDRDKAYELARDADEEDIEEENASYQQGYEDGYNDGVGKYEDWYNGEDDDEDKKFRHIFSDEEEEDCCDMFDIGYKHGYEDGYKDALEENEEAEELPEEIVLDAAVFNNIEELKTKTRSIINDLHKTNTPTETISQLWDVVGDLVDLEKEIAGREVLDYYINR